MLHIEGGARMSSGLKARLAAISAQSAASPKPAPQSRMGIVHRVHREMADPKLFQLDDAALARMGLTQPWPGIERALFLDTETTGLSRGAGTIVFMIGVGYVKDGQFIVEQQTLGDYPDEPRMMAWLEELLRHFDVLVTFNGNTFDLPLLETRAVMCRMRNLFERHMRLDLMHPSRRLWRRRLGSCRLSNLEEQVLSRGREDDLPGSEAPERFFQYLKTGDDSLLEDVRRHNMLDVVSLATLLVRLNDAYAAPSEQQEMDDLFSMGRAMERRGERELAEQCYIGVSQPRTARTMRQLRQEQLAAEAKMSISMLRKRAGDYAQAEHVWLTLTRRGQMGTMPCLELAKLYEHKTHDLVGARHYAQMALGHQPDLIEREQIERRIARLNKKIAAQAAVQEER